LGRYQIHNQLVRDVIKESFDIGIQHELVPVVGVLQHFFDGHMAVTARPEAIGVIIKQLFEDRADQASDDFLSHSTSNHGNAERSKFASNLGNMNPFERNRLIGTGFEVFIVRLIPLLGNQVGLRWSIHRAIFSK
jgi:hypothetical protein